MSTSISLAQIFRSIANDPVVEIRDPAPYSHRPREGQALVTHRFPVKGGISQREAMIRLMGNPNPLFYHFSGEPCPPHRYVLLHN